MVFYRMLAIFINSIIVALIIALICIGIMPNDSMFRIAVNLAYGGYYLWSLIISLSMLSLSKRDLLHKQNPNEKSTENLFYTKSQVLPQKLKVIFYVFVVASVLSSFSRALLEINLFPAHYQFFCTNSSVLMNGSSLMLEERYRLLSCTTYFAMTIFDPFMVAVCFVASLYVIYWSLVFREQFKNFQRKMQYDSAELQDLSTLLRYRKEFNYLSDITETFNSSHGYLMASCLIGLMMQYCILEFVIVSNRSRMQEYVNALYVLHIVTSVIFIGFIFGPASMKEKAQGTLQILRRIQPRGNQISEFSHQVSMFIEEIKEFPGFTVLGFLELTKSTFLTLIGVMITYYFLMVQFDSMK